jgi:hypothetical protein
VASTQNLPNEYFSLGFTNFVSESPYISVKNQEQKILLKNSVFQFTALFNNEKLKKKNMLMMNQLRVGTKFD